MQTSEMVSTKEVMQRLELSPEKFYAACRANVFPFVTSIPPETHGGGKWIYIIPRGQFEKYMSGELWPALIDMMLEKKVEELI